MPAPPPESDPAIVQTMGSLAGVDAAGFEETEDVNVMARRLRAVTVLNHVDWEWVQGASVSKYILRHARARGMGP